MSEKLRGEIRKIKLDSATFKSTPCTIKPTYINFFFGNNGTGKTTVGKTIQSGEGITYAPGRSAEDYVTLVYNQEFIDSNVRSYHNLGGVFTLNEKNIEIQEQIDKISQQQEDARKRQTETAEEVNKRQQQLIELQQQLYKTCWDTTLPLRKEFDKTQTGFKKMKQFTEEVNKHSPIEHDIDKLRLLYDAAYSETAKRYQYFNIIDDPAVLDTLEGREILGVVIANAAQTGFAEFLNTIGATEWFRQGHDDFHMKAQGRCPYCARILEDGFEQTIIDSFDDSYQKNVSKLKDYLNLYISRANALFKPISHLPEELFPSIKTDRYRDKLTALRGVIEGNINLVKEKVSEPSKVIALEETEILMQELSDIINGYNKIIAENNAVVDAGPKKKKECQAYVFEQMAFILKDIFETYRAKYNSIDSEIKILLQKCNELGKNIKDYQQQLTELRGQTVDTETAINNINTMLRDAGFQGFEVRPRSETIVYANGSFKSFVPSPALSYEVVRTDTKEVASNLSEGEKNFIAFLYFQQKVFGKENAEEDSRQKIVVIDDPISSMDSNALFIVGEQIRKMIELCRNNADNRDTIIKDNFIKQIFILTHNAYFHREVTYSYEKYYEYVSFFLIKKRDNISTITECLTKNPNAPSERMNANPVKNSYYALWEEYKELKDVTSSAVIMSVIRRILEYYFLQICGYDGNDLRSRVLGDHKPDLIKDEDGNVDYTKFDLASAMLSYISSNAYGINEGFHYVDEVIDTRTCKETFRLIFKYMNQDQHFNMMMHIKN